MFVEVGLLSFSVALKVLANLVEMVFAGSRWTLRVGRGLTFAEALEDRRVSRGCIEADADAEWRTEFRCSERLRL